MMLDIYVSKVDVKNNVQARAKAQATAKADAKTTAKAQAPARPSLTLVRAEGNLGQSYCQS